MAEWASTWSLVLATLVLQTQLMSSPPMGRAFHTFKLRYPSPNSKPAPPDPKPTLDPNFVEVPAASVG